MRRLLLAQTSQSNIPPLACKILLESSSRFSITNLCADFSKVYPITKHGICSSSGNLVVCRRRSYIARTDRSRLFCCRAEIFARKGSLARGGGCNELSLSLAPPLSTAGYDNNNPNCVINSIWKQDTNEVYYMAPSARRLLAIQRNQTTGFSQ